jgi:hypothetical protein
VRVNESNKMCLLINVNEKLRSQKVYVQLREINGTCVLDTFHYVLEYCLQLDCIIVFLFNDAEVDSIVWFLFGVQHLSMTTVPMKSQFYRDKGCLRRGIVL